MEQAFTDFSARKLRQLTTQARTCAAPRTREQLWWRAAGDQNAVGNLLLHLTGNVRQWIVSGVGGAEDIRVRDREFLDARGCGCQCLGHAP